MEKSAIRPTKKPGMNIRRLTTDAILLAVALIIFVIELSLPSLTPVPGIKLGLANIVTLVTMFALGPVDAFLVMILRVILGCVLSGQMMALAYSMAGGVLSYLLMLIMRKLVTVKQIFVCSVFCAIAHNVGQILVAWFLTNTAAIFFYLPVLCVSGIIAGLFTGLAAQYTTGYMKKIIKKI